MKKLLLLLVLFSQVISAEEKPLWELGIGLAGLHQPHYLGAEQGRSFALPFPYINYRGKYIRADRQGIRGAIYDSDKLDLRLSLSGSLPVNSEDNDAREGMDDLDLMLEFGPTLQYQLYDSDQQLLRFDIPIRGGFTFGDNFFHHQGWTTNPRLHHEFYANDWKITSTAGVVFSDSRYHGYIYDVDPVDVTPDRPFYQATGGYTGARFSVGTKRRIGKYFVGAKLRYYNLSGADNNASPLLLEPDYFSFTIYFAWIFSESDTMVKSH